MRDVLVVYNFETMESRNVRMKAAVKLLKEDRHWAIQDCLNDGTLVEIRWNPTTRVMEIHGADLERSTCYNCKWKEPNRGFCCCPSRVPCGEENTFSEITQERESNNDIESMVCEHHEAD